MMRSTAFLFSVLIGLGTMACSSDDSSGGGGGSGGSATGGSAGSGASAGAGGTSGSAGAAGAAGRAGASGSSGAPAKTFAALVRGDLAKSNLDDAKKDHDALASAGEAPAKAAGDLGHDVLLGTTLLGTTQNQFMALDEWNNDTNMDGFYADPNFQKGFGALFSAPPTLETFEHQPTWHGWGDINAGKASDPHFYVVVRGKLRAGDLSVIKTEHDALAAGGEAPAKAAGDVAHLVFLGRADDHEFFALDIWSKSDNLEAFYSDPNFQAGFAKLFDGAPTLGVYQSTDWHQW